jgi:hypothetical protein
VELRRLVQLAHSAGSEPAHAALEPAAPAGPGAGGAGAAAPAGPGELHGGEEGGGGGEGEGEGSGGRITEVLGTLNWLLGRGEGAGGDPAAEEAAGGAGAGGEAAELVDAAILEGLELELGTRAFKIDQGAPPRRAPASRPPRPAPPRPTPHRTAPFRRRAPRGAAARAAEAADGAQGRISSRVAGAGGCRRCGAGARGTRHRVGRLRCAGGRTSRTRG